jgi:mycoredoxin
MTGVKQLLWALGIITAVTASALAAPARAPSEGSAPKISSLSQSSITIYGANWCSACKSLEKTLQKRDIPFDWVDVDKNPQQYERARSASGTGNAIPLTSVVRGSDTVWFVGADPDGVEKAYRGE